MKIGVKALIYLNENARHVNFVVLMHSISHSPTERTLSESRTIDLKNRVPSIARKKHSEKRDDSKISPKKFQTKLLTCICTLSTIWVDYWRCLTHLWIIGHCVNIIVSVWFDVWIVIQMAHRSIAQQTIVSCQRWITIAVGDAIEFILCMAHSLAFGHRWNVVHKTNHRLVQSKTFAAFYRTFCEKNVFFFEHRINRFISGFY